MKADLNTATDVLRALAEEHLVDEFGHLRGVSQSSNLVIGFLLAAGEAEYHDILDPYGFGGVFCREVRLIARKSTEDQSST